MASHNVKKTTELETAFYQGCGFSSGTVLQPSPGVLPTEHKTKIRYSSSPHIAQRSNLDYCMRIQYLDLPTMHIYEETCEWLDLPSPLEMYKHHAALLEDEIAALHLQLRKARDNVRGLVQMNDELATGKAIAETALKKALADAGRLNQETSEMGRRINGLMAVVEQRDHLFRENQRLLMERNQARSP